MNDDDLTPAPEWLTAALADTPPVSADARETAISRALDVFDRMHTAPNVVAFPNRRRWYRPVAAAAAVAVLGVVAVGALTGLSGSDSDMSSSASVLSDDALAKTSPASQDAGGGATPTINAINATAMVVPAVSSEDQLRALPTPEAALPDLTATTVSAAAAETIVDTTRASAAYTAITFAFDCQLTADQVVLGEITWMGQQAAAVRDTVTGVTQAIDPQCNVLATVAP
jgi:hypothetical protein